jgi:hypothetical protein
MLIWRAVGYTNAQEEANSFFNYGFIPQNLGRPRTERFIAQRWRHNPLDMMEIGATSNSSTKKKWTNKIICLPLSDPGVSSIHTM